MGLPPVSLGGVNSANGKLLPKHNLKVPQLQFIDMGGLDAAIDTGNDNCIYDPNLFGGPIGDTFKDSSPDVAPTTSGTGTSVNLSSQRVTTSLQVGEVAEMLLEKANSASALGEQYTINFSIKPGQTYKVNQIEFDYYTSASYADGFFRVYIWDETNGAYLGELTQRDIAANEHGKYIGTFQATDATDYSLVLHCTDSSSANWTMRLANFYIGLKSSVKGAVVTDWQSYTPTFAGFGTVTGLGCWYRRVGDSLQVRARGTAGTVDGTTASISLPSGLSLDSSKITNSPLSVVGNFINGGGIDNSDFRFNIVASSNNSTIVQISRRRSGSMSELVARAGNLILANSEAFSFTFEVPIAGWSSNLVLSEDTGNRVVAFRARRSSTQTVSSTALTPIIFETILFDTTSSYNSSTGEWICPESGYYDFTAGANLANMSTTGDTYNLNIYVNGSNVAFAVYGDSTEEPYQVKSGPLSLSKGDVVNVRIQSATDTSYDIVSSIGSFFSAFKIQTPQSIASGEFVGASYISDTGGDTANQGNILINATKNFDSHNAYSTSTGIFTVPVSGKYLVTVGARSQAVVGAIGNVWAIDLQKNSSDYMRIAEHNVETTTSKVMFCSGSFTIDCVRGDTLRLEFNDNITNSVSLSTGAGDCSCSFIKVG